jgi:hypothetical protein
MTEVPMFGPSVEQKAKQIARLDPATARDEFNRIVELTFKQDGEKFVYGLACNAYLVTYLRQMGQFDRIWETSS